MNKAVIYIHGKGGSASEADHFKPLFSDFDVIGFDYRSQTPWQAKTEFPSFFDTVCKKYGETVLLANSIGAFFSLCALSNQKIDQALFISPVVDMERLILDMMVWSGVTEADLQERKEIPTAFGETLSWDYLCDVRNNPIRWNVPTEILYGENDVLIQRETVTAFADRVGAHLTVMPKGEHWFHTEEQMQFLDAWIRRTAKI